ncbi:sodium:proton antiporter [Bradyrhizobium prioriisuperbiae]|uniref:sodium:proton antiporter n=1 Tax=Bradyrhizobium prioriisuperbiae TaxID=2854389 RepID=UPI0028F034D9|nr:sodium:proton antiporter [Bradyrhizobium prioritasuperba]
MPQRLTAALLVLLLLCRPAAAAELDGARLAWPWALPFAGILLTIATGPLLFKRIWHHHYGKFALAWGAATLLPLALWHGWPAAAAAFIHAALAEYLSFIVLLFALYVVAGGILVTGNLRGTPLVNTVLLAFGTLIASVVGTTGAAMILIRPLLRANEHRPSNAHVVVFFIFLVCNIGGALSPLGDPPLFIGFLRGVDFFWTTQHLWGQTLAVSVAVLAIFVAFDVVLSRREGAAGNGADINLQVHGLINLLLIALIIAAILGSAIWKPGIVFDIYGTDVELQNLLRDGVLVLIALLSLWLTPDEHREANGFSFEPIREVAILFAAIFVCIIPVLAMLQAGPDGPFASLLAAVTTPDGQPRNVMYFWLTGALSGFLDNAPTYLVFFGLAGGDAERLMTTLAPTLAAISMGAVYMGALTYIGNAPNFMVYAIATERGVPMPGFFGYIVWSVVILGPVFVVLSLLGV